MAANKTNFCSRCGKDNGRVICNGCSQLFCPIDYNSHQQDLGTQLDEIEVARDLFRQALSEIISKPQNHALIEEIDAWENRSIDTIRQAAEEARQALLQHTAELNTKLEAKLDELTNQLRQSRAENDFFEPNLRQWNEKLGQMKNDLTKTSSVRIRNNTTPLVTKIVVDILDRLQQSDENEDEVRIPCEWCNQQVSLDLFQHHTEACRDKEHKRLEDELGRNGQQVMPIPAYRPVDDSAIPTPFYRPIVDSAIPTPVYRPVVASAIPTPFYRPIVDSAIPTPVYRPVVASAIPSTTNTAQCKFCGKAVSAIGIEYHQLVCGRNPMRNNL